MFLWRSSKKVQAPHLAIGEGGERVAELYLKTIGFDVWHKNIRIGRRYEIDLIAFDPRDRVVVFVEVKSRKVFHPDFRPELCFTYDKKQNFQQAARHWIGLHEYDGGYRMDLICVADGKVINHVENLDLLPPCPYRQRFR